MIMIHYLSRHPNRLFQVDPNIVSILLYRWYKIYTFARDQIENVWMARCSSVSGFIFWFQSLFQLRSKLYLLFSHDAEPNTNNNLIFNSFLSSHNSRVSYSLVLINVSLQIWRLGMRNQIRRHRHHRQSCIRHRKCNVRRYCNGPINWKRRTISMPEWCHRLPQPFP